MTTLEKIRTLRRLKDYSEEYLALQLGITQSTYSKIESGKINLTEEIREKIIRGLDTTVEEFEKLDHANVFNFHQQEGEIVGQAINSNDVDAIMKIMEEVTAPYKS